MIPCRQFGKLQHPGGGSLLLYQVVLAASPTAADAGSRFPGDGGKDSRGWMVRSLEAIEWMWLSEPNWVAGQSAARTGIMSSSPTTKTLWPAV
jgi:hypothetical protein